MSEIRYKDLKVLRGMFTVAWHPFLIALFLWLVVRYSKGKILLTSAYRKGDAGVHGQVPLRGIDLRSYRIFPNPEEICEDINAHWTYDSNRPEMKVAMYHNAGSGFHIHLQVHPNTVFTGSLKPLPCTGEKS